MLASFTTSLIVMLCTGCAATSQDPQILPLAIIQMESHQPAPASAAGDKEFAQSAWTGSNIAARLNALDLVTPAPARTMSGDRWSAGVSFGVSAETTGLGLDLSVTPHAQIRRSAAGVNSARAGAEIRFGADLITRDQRGTDAPAPSWYVFVGADNEALVWNLVDRRALDGVALRNQATIGDLQAGVAWTVTAGGQVSLGLVERRLRFDDPTGKNDVDRKDRFAALSFTLHH